MLERLDNSRWQRLPGAIGDTYLLQDTDGRVIRRVDASMLAGQRMLQWRVPVRIGARGADAFWWYRDAVYRGARGLAWWDIEALSPAAVSLAPAPAEVAATSSSDARLPVRRARRHIQEHGLHATATKVGERLRPYMRLDEAHVWSVLHLHPKVEPRGFGPSLSLARGASADLEALEGFPTPVTKREGQRRLDDGCELWLVKDGAIPAFVCWIFTTTAPVIAAPGGQMRLAPGDVVLEDTATAETHRGRGIAPTAWLSIARDLSDRGYRRMLTKVEVENAPSRRAVEKAGFIEAATVHVRRTGPRIRVAVTELGDAHVAAMLRERLR